MLLSMRAEVETGLSEALERLGYPTDDLGIERPPDDVDAVLASSVAFRLAEVAGEAPPVVAAELADAFDTSDREYVRTVRTQGPYLNFLPAERYAEATLAAATEDGYGHLDPRDQSVVVEHTSANPTGPVHVGRARNPIIGDPIANLLDYAGYDVERHYYVNDAGRQIAMFTWAYERFDESDLPDPERDRPDYDLVRYYRKGSTFLEEGPEDAVAEAEAEIQAILQGLEEGEAESYDRVSTVVETVLGGMQQTLARLPASFDEFVRETRFMRDGSTEDVVARLRDTEHAVYEEEAWQLDLPDIDKNLVFLRSDDTSLYTTRDLAHHEWKFENFDRAVTVLGEDHELQARQLRSALDLLGHDTDQLETVHLSWVNLPEGGMSTREGTGIDLDDLLDEAIRRARAEVEDRLDGRMRDDELTEADIDRIARQVGIGAVRYDIVARQPTKTITFEWERALDFEAQSAPYIQYVHARASGILDEAEQLPDPTAVETATLDSEAERDLIREIARFPAVVEAAAEGLEPPAVATYAREFAETFNSFYRECPVLDAPGETRRARLALVAAAQTTVANALDILGIAAPESM